MIAPQQLQRARQALGVLASLEISQADPNLAQYQAALHALILFFRAVRDDAAAQSPPATVVPLADSSAIDGG